MIERARAKVNLYLHIVGRRADGLHLLDSLAVFPEVADRVSAEPAEELGLSLQGPFSSSLTGQTDNLVLRAAQELAACAGVSPRVRLVLEKNLPVASGIGGGSADAAATLRLLQRRWDAAPGLLPGLAAKLGADVPVCLLSRPARMGGIGEVLGPAPALPPCGVVLVNPGLPLPTRDVFRTRTGPFSEPARLPRAWPDPHAMAVGLAGLRNDLQPAAIFLAPEIGRVLDAIASLPGCLLARMSGSGATCLGLFATAAEAQSAAVSLTRPGCWCWGGGLAGDRRK
ncbi:MAG: 4-(cytidine 5'-diphospho)-2-C-methyl-D-erythritol kinase [Acetobacteraceae bacterium]|nr:4-(cytidine 5'-diphospho)-2-C-methyl-D-erythritol kinase [Acetobacteraceae bacterium]MBV8525120.1 4-(cytidine 5'-diphospho)-2-C-methyl-D-erythritol kinase [Acetobacteraceae bacterium]MBV8590205.1 4-(cytidine 5'-diphospho)-2-C-methyl-D-erythritol kinase [Acetobacteraceae bacterium]